MDKPPLVSLGMSVYNAGAALRLALVSILKQTYSHWELILIDDGSTDETASRVSEFKDPRIRFISDGVNKGLPARLNQAVGLAQGKYFARMDADDISYPERLERQVAFLEQNQGIDLVGSSMMVFKERGEIIGIRYAPSRHEAICCHPESGFLSWHPTWMGRKEWFIRNPYDERAVLCEDQALLLRTFGSSRFANITAPLLGYREKKLSFRKQLKARYYWSQKLYKFFFYSKKWPDVAFLAVAGQLVKAMFDAFAIFTGLDYFLLRHRARPDSKESSRKWGEVYRSVGNARKKVCFLATVPFVVRAFLLEHARCLSEEYDVTIVTNLGSDAFDESFLKNIRFVHIPFSRKPDPMVDLKCLVCLTRFLKNEGFDSIHSITPKAGLLAMAAGWLAGIKVRIHTFTGQVWATQSGVTRFSLKILDRFFSGLATHLFADSNSQRDFLLKEGVISPGQSKVLGAGSICGVDTIRFAPNLALRLKTRDELGFSPDETVFLFLGRLKRDKGILMLADAYQSVLKKCKAARLLIVGPDEEDLHCHPSFKLPGNPVVFIGYTNQPGKYMNAADVFCLPSRREGFGSSIIEAACVGTPAVASRIYGITDAVVDGKTGLLHDPYSAEDLAGCMERLLQDPELRKKMGAAARERAVKEFPKERLTTALRDAYQRILGEKP